MEIMVMLYKAWADSHQFPDVVAPLWTSQHMKRVGNAEHACASSRFDHAENTNVECSRRGGGRQGQTRARLRQVREGEANDAPTDPEATGIGWVRDRRRRDPPSTLRPLLLFTGLGGNDCQTTGLGSLGCEPQHATPIHLQYSFPCHHTTLGIWPL